MSGKSTRVGLLSGEQSVMAAPRAARSSEQLGQAPTAPGDISSGCDYDHANNIGLPARAVNSAPREGARGARNAAERSPRMRASVEAALRTPARPAIASMSL